MRAHQLISVYPSSTCCLRVFHLVPQAKLRDMFSPSIAGRFENPLDIAADIET